MKAAALVLLTACVLCGQDSALDRLADSADRLRYVPEDDPDAARPLVARFERYLREWIETQLPKKPDAEALLAKLRDGIARAGLSEEVGTLDVTHPLADTDALLIVAGVTAPCGTRDSALLYEWTPGGPVLTLDSHGRTIVGVNFSPSDDHGDRLALVAGREPDCGGRPRVLEFTLYRLPAGAGTARVVYRDSHSAVRGEYRAEMRPDRVRIELEGRTIDPAVTRTHVLRFRVDAAQAVRIDPVALTPWEFADEWLTAPWGEMQTRSAPAVERRLHRPGLTGRLRYARACTRMRDHWQVAMELDKPDPSEDEDPVQTVYFLVRQYSGSRFEMAAAGGAPHAGCAAD